MAKEIFFQTGTKPKIDSTSEPRDEDSFGRGGKLMLLKIFMESRTPVRALMPHGYAISRLERRRPSVTK